MIQAVARSETPTIRTLATQSAGMVVRRDLDSGARTWAVYVGQYRSRQQAEKILLRTALADMGTLMGARRQIVRSDDGFDAKFIGMTLERANLACQRLQAQQATCAVVSSG